MQFIPHGPNIPNELLQAHEEGRVVFFCGAGISYPAGLPNFEGLVERIYELSYTTRSGIEQEAFNSERFDITLDLLEQRFPGQRQAVRPALAQALEPKLYLKGATNTHTALLRLGRSREGTLRLITTNFDRVFHAAARRIGQKFQDYAAPMLPIPKNRRWNGLVYLHGLLPEKPDDTTTALDQLVVTSGDFGRAYHTERWAAHFVSDLLYNYIVCFVGYSINDPALRYMTDALASDRMLGEVTPQAWALGACKPGKECSETNKWKAKGVTPILYKVPADSDDHSMLHRTLRAWANIYHNGIRGKTRIIDSYALKRPADSTQQNDFVGRMLWALSDKSGLPAKRFAEFNPAPSLDWLLEAFSDERFQHSDLACFRVPPHDEVDTQLRFSLIHRPAPYDRAPPMLLASRGITSSQWDNVMPHLAHWLVRHLDEPRLVIWIAQRGGQLHDSWTWLIEKKLDHLASLEREGKTTELKENRLQAPKAIPGPLMRTLWRLLLSGRVKSHRRDFDLYRWKDRLKRDGLTATLRLELRKLLTPQVALQEPCRWGNEVESADEPTRMRHLVHWELRLAVDDDDVLPGLADERWASVLPLLLEDFQQLLRDALDLQRELGEANYHRDHSHLDLPSITPHRQNQHSSGWVCLIKLLRDAWHKVHSQDSARAIRIAQAWFEQPYPIFKRLALFAASKDACIASEQWVDWLLADRAWWLWSENTEREVCRLLVLQGRRLTEAIQEHLEAAILSGPPREMYRDDLEPDRWQWQRSVWLRLAKLNASDLTLGAAAKTRLAELSRAYPQWQLKDNQSDEFRFWTTRTGYPDYEEIRNIDIAPRKRHELVQWLTKPQPEQQSLYEDTWRKVCRTRFFPSLFALCDLARDGVWPANRWGSALQTWSKGGMILRSWRYTATLVQTMPDTVIQEISHDVTRWIRAASESIDCREDILLVLDLCRRVLALPLEADTGMTHNGETIDQPVDNKAISHPVGRVTRALINIWLKRNPNDNDLLPTDIEPLFTELCDLQVDRFRHGRVFLSSQLITFFRVDRPWTEQYLLPLFDWNNSAEAKAVWAGFLWSPHLYQPLLTAFKPQFLESANHYTDLGKHRKQFAAFLTYAALDPIEGYTADEFRFAIEKLPQDGIEESMRTLFRTLEGTDDQREDYWKNRIQPFWQQVWPKYRNLATPRIAAFLARLIIAARGEFPAALAAVQYWLQPIEHPGLVVHLLQESGLCSRYPVDALRLLDAVITDQQWVPQELGKCLDEIEQAAPQLVKDAQYQRLREYLRRRRV